MDPYTGSVCFVGGWHYTVNDDGSPGDKLVGEISEDGEMIYRLADDSDTESWNDLTHKNFVSVVPTDGVDGALRVTPDQLDSIKSFLASQEG